MSKFSILTVDDDVLIQGLIIDVLSDSYDVSAVSSGEECLQTIDTLCPDLIILDVSMPGGLNGFETCQLLKQKKTIKNTPIIFVSAQSSESERLKGYESGGSDYIVKPFNIEILLTAIDFNLELARENDQQDNLKTHLSRSTESAIEALIYSNELNHVIHFYETSEHFKSIESIASEVLKITSELGLRSVVQTRGDGVNHEFSDYGVVTPLERQVIAEKFQNEVFYQINQHLMINYSNISILIKNMPLQNDASNDIHYQKLKEILRALTYAANSSIVNFYSTSYGMSTRTETNFSIIVDLLMMKLQNKSEAYRLDLESLLNKMNDSIQGVSNKNKVINTTLSKAKLLCINKTDLSTIRNDISHLIEIMNEDLRSN